MALVQYYGFTAVRPLQPLWATLIPPIAWLAFSQAARQFSFVMDAKSIITSPAYPERLSGAGWWPVRGIAWSGRGKITGVDVSTDGGKSWVAASLVGDVHSRAHTRFEHLWKWDGRPTSIMSRAVDETGYVQPTLEVYKRVSGASTSYHHNAIRTWLVASDGTLTFGG